jgi:hypothetical protein
MFLWDQRGFGSRIFNKRVQQPLVVVLLIQVQVVILPQAIITEITTTTTAKKKKRKTNKTSCKISVGQEHSNDGPVDMLMN